MCLAVTRKGSIAASLLHTAAAAAKKSLYFNGDAARLFHPNARPWQDFFILRRIFRRPAELSI
jgi:hypothetical protein